MTKKKGDAMTKEEQKKEIVRLQREVASLREERTKLQKRRFQLEALYLLWKQSALRYQGIAAALSHAYNALYPPDLRTYGSAVFASHSNEPPI